MTDFAIVFGLVFLLICVVSAALHSLRVGRLTLLDWAMLGMGGVYGAGWMLVIWVTEEGGNPIWERWLLPFERLYALHTLSALFLLGSVWFGWLLVGLLHFRGRLAFPQPSKSVDARLTTAMWVMLAIAFVMQWLYTLAYGGLIGQLKYSASIRSGIFQVENPLSFLQPFGGLALLASFGFFGLLLSVRRSFAIGLGFLLSFLFSLYLLYSWLGRIAFLVYLATFVLGAFLSRRPRPLVLMAGGSVAMLAVIIGAYYVSVWLNLKPADDLAVFLARELAFPFGSFFAQLDLGDQHLRAFKDFLFAPIYLLPTSWWSQWVQDVGQVNTALILGAPKGEQGVTGAIPVDLLTLGLMQLSMLGIPIVGILFGALLRLIQRLLDQLASPGIRAIFEACVALKIAVLGIFYAQPALFVQGNFGLIVAVLVMAVFINAPRLRLTGARNTEDTPALEN